MLKSLRNAALAVTLTLASQGVMATETVKVGMSGTYFPFTFVKKDQLQGFEVDVWNEVAKRNDYSVEFVTSNFSGLFGLLESGRIDTISNQITMTQARKAKYLFADAYVVDGAQVVTRKGSDIQGLADLKGKTVAVNLGSNYEQLLRANDANNEINIKTYDTGIEQELMLGRIDAFVMDRVSSAQLIKEHNLPFVQAGDTFETIENAWPLLNNAKGEKLQAELNSALTAMRADGTLGAISKKWFDADITAK